MTHVNRHVPVQNSALNDLVVSLFTGAILVLSGFLTFAQFATV
ncbi:MAG TPA: hypothetical protein VMJ73_05775 [Rhizomicrobium sp.]|nr:hypothetical protein [Rhizomicrobium sp.]